MADNPPAANPAPDAKPARKRNARAKISFDAKTGVVTLVPNGADPKDLKTVRHYSVFEVEGLPKNIASELVKFPALMEALCYGHQEHIRDSYAEPDSDLLLEADAVHNNYKRNIVSGGGGNSVIVQAIARVQEWPIERAMAAWAKASEENKTKTKADERIKAAIAQISAERAAARVASLPKDAKPAALPL